MKRILVPDQMGGYVHEWKESRTIWATLESWFGKPYPKTVLEGNKAGTLAFKENLYKVDIRLGDYGLFERFKWQNKTFAIVSPFNQSPTSDRTSFFVTEVSLPSEKEREND
tara:strand:- start:103 stop:435 length:333 start_codon:yes stop_codon:yes gene_type:complete